MATDDGSQIRPHKMERFLTGRGVEHRISADYNPNSNLREQTGVKTAKWLLMSSKYSDRSFGRVSRALLKHRNTPIKDLNISLAKLLFKTFIRDLLPVRPEQKKTAETWSTYCEQQ